LGDHFVNDLRLALVVKRFAGAIKRLAQDPGRIVIKDPSSLSDKWQDRYNFMRRVHAAPRCPLEAILHELANAAASAEAKPPCGGRRGYYCITGTPLRECS